MSPEFKKYQPLTLRLWHWLNAITILGLLGTVLLRKTFLSWRANAELLQEKAPALGVSGLTAEAAGSLARAIRDPMWEWHHVLGFALVGLLVFRVLQGRFALRPGGGHSLHFKLVKAGHALFYAAVLFMACTGLALYFKAPLGISKEVATTLKEGHELATWFFAFFVAAHIVGVIAAEFRGERGLVSDMINGGDQTVR